MTIRSRADLCKARLSSRSSLVQASHQNFWWIFTRLSTMTICFGNSMKEKSGRLSGDVLETYWLAISLTRAPFKAELEDANVSNLGRDLDALRIFIAVAASSDRLDR
jgi:hypothetical protein